jgi:hypothetical protein
MSDEQSLLRCFRSDGTLDIAIALEQLDEDSQLDEPSLLGCIRSDGGLYVGKFRQFQDAASLFELTLLKEAGLIENDNTPTGATVEPAGVRRVTMRHSRSLLHQVWDGECQRRATPKDSLWWKMYVEQPMVNVPKSTGAFIIVSGCHMHSLCNLFLMLKIIIGSLIGRRGTVLLPLSC